MTVSKTSLPDGSPKSLLQQSGPGGAAPARGPPRTMLQTLLQQILHDEFARFLGAALFLRTAARTGVLWVMGVAANGAFALDSRVRAIVHSASRGEKPGISLARPDTGRERVETTPCGDTCCLCGTRHAIPSVSVRAKPPVGAAMAAHHIVASGGGTITRPHLSMRGVGGPIHRTAVAESHRDSWRLHFVRRWSQGKGHTVFRRGPGAGGSVGAGAHGRPRIPVGRDHVGGGEALVFRRDAAEVGPAGGA